MRNRRWMGAIPLALFLLSQSSCVDEEVAVRNARRTILVYMGGDNNLSSETEAKIQALSIGWNHPDARLIIYQDQGKSPRLLEVTPQGISTICTYSSEDSAAKETLRRAVHDMMTLYPADSYGLIVFSHGTGWLPQGMFARPRTIVVDSQSKSEMKLADFSDAVNGCHFRFIIFEACLMASVEVALELQGKTDYLVASASEMFSPGFTNMYPAMRELLFLPEPDLIGFARTYYDYWNAKTGYNRSATISVIRTSAVQNLVEATFPIWNNSKVVAPQDVVCFDNSDDKNLYSDLGDYIRLKAETDQQYAIFKQAMEKAVIYQAATPYLFGRKIKSHSGLSVYLPHPEYPLLNEAYRHTLWSRQMNL